MTGEAAALPKAKWPDCRPPGPSSRSARYERSGFPDHRSSCCGRTPPTRRCSTRRARKSGRAGGATCAENADHPRAKELFDPAKASRLPRSFAGGGALPLEAQRLGLESYASDLNPVAVLINKAMIEIPPKFAGKPPVNPESRKEQDADRARVAGRAGLGRGRALLRPVDARRGREAHRPSLPEGRGHGGDGEGAAGPEAVRRQEAHRDRLALGAHGEESKPGLSRMWTCRSPPPSCSPRRQARRPTSSQ